MCPVSSIHPISELTVGQRLRLVKIDGGVRLIRRLLALGICVGSEAELIQRRAGGVVLARNGNRIAIGEGISRKLFAEVIE